VLLSPLYWLFSWITGTYSLLIIQWAFITTGAWATYRYILLRSDNVTAALAMLLYFVLFGRFSAYRADANLSTIGSSLVPLLFLLFETNRKKWMLLVFSFLLLTREDFSLWLGFICLFFAWQHRRERGSRNLALLMSGTAFLFFIITFAFIIPAFLEDDNKKYSLFDYKALGAGPVEALMYMVSHPVQSLKLLFVNHKGEGYYDNLKMEFYVVYLLSGGILLLFRPALLIPFLPLLAKKMYNDSPIRWSIETYYSAEVVAILPLMCFIVISSIGKISRRRQLAAIICLAAAVTTAYKMLVPAPNPLLSESNKYNIVHRGFYKADYDPASTHTLLREIPKNAAVSASSRLVPHLAFREKIYYFPRVEDADYIILFRNNDSYPLTPEQFEAEVLKYRNNSEWHLVRETGEALLLARRP
jgi:hypothetical protein